MGKGGAESFGERSGAGSGGWRARPDPADEETGIPRMENPGLRRPAAHGTIPHAVRKEMRNMAGFVPKDKLSKKARKELDRRRRTVWSFSPVTRTVDSKKVYKRRKRARDRYDDDGAGSFHIRPEFSSAPAAAAGIRGGLRAGGRYCVFASG